jgi:hypothetical protein
VERIQWRAHKKEADNCSSLVVFGIQAAELDTQEENQIDHKNKVVVRAHFQRHHYLLSVLYHLLS